MAVRYEQSFKDRAVRMVLDRLNDDDSGTPSAVVKEIAPRLGVARETLRGWVNQTSVDDENALGFPRRNPLRSAG